jgi:hypothetical protein
MDPGEPTTKDAVVESVGTSGKAPTKTTFVNEGSKYPIFEYTTSNNTTMFYTEVISWMGARGMKFKTLEGAKVGGGRVWSSAIKANAAFRGVVGAVDDAAQAGTDEVKSWWKSKPKPNLQPVRQLPPRSTVAGLGLPKPQGGGRRSRRRKTRGRKTRGRKSRR